MLRKISKALGIFGLSMMAICTTIVFSLLWILPWPNGQHSDLSIQIIGKLLLALAWVFVMWALLWPLRTSQGTPFLDAVWRRYSLNWYRDGWILHLFLLSFSAGLLFLFWEKWEVRADWKVPAKSELLRVEGKLEQTSQPRRGGQPGLLKLANGSELRFTCNPHRNTVVNCIDEMRREKGSLGTSVLRPTYRELIGKTASLAYYKVPSDRAVDNVAMELTVDGQRIYSYEQRRIRLGLLLTRDRLAAAQPNWPGWLTLLLMAFYFVPGICIRLWARPNAKMDAA